MSSFLSVLELLDNCQEKCLVSHDALEVCEEEEDSSNNVVSFKGGFAQAKRLPIISESMTKSDCSVESNSEMGEMVIEPNSSLSILQDATSRKDGTTIFQEKLSSCENLTTSVVTHDSSVGKEILASDSFWDQKLHIKSQKVTVADTTFNSLNQVHSHASEPQLNKMENLGSMRDVPETLENGRCFPAKSNGSCDDLPALGSFCNNVAQRKPIYASKSYENIGSKKVLDGVSRVWQPFAKQLSERSLKYTQACKQRDSLEGKQQGVCDTAYEHNDSDDEIKYSDASRSSSTTSFSTVGSGYSRPFKKVEFVLLDRFSTHWKM